MKKINIVVLFLLYLVTVKVNLKAADNDKKEDTKKSTEKGPQSFDINYLPPEVLVNILSYSGFDINSITDSNINQLYKIAQVNKHFEKIVNDILQRFQEKTDKYLEDSKFPINDAIELRNLFAKRWLQKRAANDNKFAKKVGQKLRKYLRILESLTFKDKLTKEQKQQQKEVRLQANFLIKTGIGLDLRGDRGDNALILAVESGNTDLAKRLLNTGADPDVGSTLGENPLTAAINQGNVRMVKELLKGKADPNKKTVWGDTPLIRAVSEIRAAPEMAQNEKKIIKLLLKHGANVDAQVEDGNTALMIDALAGDVDTVRILLESGADPNIQDFQEMTALLKIFKFSNPASFFSGNSDSEDDEDMGDDIGDYEPFNEFEFDEDHKEIVKLLLKHGADPNIQDDKNRTALIEAVCAEKPVDVVELLLENKANPENRANPDLQDNNGDTALIEAATHANLGLVKLLVRYCADPTVKNDLKKTALIVVKDTLDNLKKEAKAGPEEVDFQEAIIHDNYVNELQDIIKLLKKYKSEFKSKCTIS